MVMVKSTMKVCGYFCELKKKLNLLRTEPFSNDLKMIIIPHS